MRALFVLLLAACGNSSADCERACTWRARWCTEPTQSCVRDCMETTESAKEAISRCVEGKGFPTPSTCQSAGCCLRFVYDDYQQRCVGR